MLSFVRAFLCSATSFFLMLLLGATAAMASQKPFNIDAEEAPRALLEFGRQSAVQILFASEKVKGVITNAVHGSYEPIDALQLLLKGTPLAMSVKADGVLVVDLARAPGVASPNSTSSDKGSDTKEGKKNSSQDFRVAQVDQGAAGPQVEKGDDQKSEKKKKEEGLSEIVVTGSRIPRMAQEGAQEVKVYTREQIEQSGQSNVSDFLSTLPSASVAVGESTFQPYFSTTVQLRGLPIGTTVVLLDGRRVETSGLQASQNFFDLNSIPLAAVERIEVVPDGSSAIYGSDAIAGVVNIILKKNFDGLEADTKYGLAADTHESNTSVVWGRQWSKGSVSIVGSYQSRSELNESDRKLTSNSDYSAYGGPNNNFPICNPGNVFFPNGFSFNGQPPVQYAAVPAGFTGTPSIQEFSGTANTLNKCDIYGHSSIIPETRRTGFLLRGSYKLTPDIELFADLMYSHVDELQYYSYPRLFGLPGFQSYTVSPSNPYNPFGTTVGVSGLFTTVGRSGQLGNTEFFRPLVGARGSLFSAWEWELAAWSSEDFTKGTVSDSENAAAVQAALNSSNPATALNPFKAGPQGSQSLLQSLFYNARQTFMGSKQAVNGFLRGPVLRLPSGPVELVIGGEYSRDALSEHDIDVPFLPQDNRVSFQRHAYAVFAEGRIPILANRTNPQLGDALALTVAGRYDNYNDFGTKITPQLGAEWRPLDTLLIRGTYAKAFKAPSLFDLHSAQSTSGGAVVSDPLTGQQELVDLVQGGNPALHPVTGDSRAFGFVYSSKAIPDLQLSITNWKIGERNNIQSVDPQTIVSNADLFSGNVIRAPGSNGRPGPITTVIDTEINFGEFNVAGFDYQLNYRYQSAFGNWAPSLSATQIYHYTQILTPGAATIQAVSKAQDTGDWAPRWKGMVALKWDLGPYTANIAGRYVGRYQDYDNTREIGDFWLCDATFLYNIGKSHAPNNDFLKGVYIGFGAVNLFNSLPQYSNWAHSFLGFDATQADIRGRFVYVRLGSKW